MRPTLRRWLWVAYSLWAVVVLIYGAQMLWKFASDDPLGTAFEWVKAHKRMLIGLLILTAVVESWDWVRDRVRAIRGKPEKPTSLQE